MTSGKEPDKRPEMKTPYGDIIHLPHPVSRNHPQMPLRDRAAQFAPFAALTGFGAAIQETADKQATADSNGKIFQAKKGKR